MVAYPRLPGKGMAVPTLAAASLVGRAAASHRRARYCCRWRARRCCWHGRAVASRLNGGWRNGRLLSPVVGGAVGQAGGGEAGALAGKDSTWS